MDDNYTITMPNDAEITRLNQENQRLRAALVACEIETAIDADSTHEFNTSINILKEALSGESYDLDMKFIARFNHDKIDINELG